MESRHEDLEAFIKICRDLSIIPDGALGIDRAGNVQVWSAEQKTWNTVEEIPMYGRERKANIPDDDKIMAEEQEEDLDDEDFDDEDEEYEEEEEESPSSPSTPRPAVAIATQVNKVKINCKGGKKECVYCGPERKEKFDGKRAIIEGKGLKIDEGPDKGKEVFCPPERRVPIGGEEYKEPEPEPEPEPPKPPPPQVRDFGYGPACERCHATRGECHSEDCPLNGEKVA